MFRPGLLEAATFALFSCLTSGYFRGEHFAYPLPSATHCSLCTVIALLSFITASVDVTAQSANCPFMSTAPKQCFSLSFPITILFVCTPAAISPSKCLQGYFSQ